MNNSAVKAVETPKAASLRIFNGRKPVLVAPMAITRDNVVTVLEQAKVVQMHNQSDCCYLHSYFLGDQPIKSKVNLTRPEINHVVVENRAYQITKDRTDALAGEPITYSAHGNNGAKHGEKSDIDAVSHMVQRLNDACTAADKHACDLELVQWMCECGVGYRLILPTQEVEKGDDAEQPFKVVALDPRSTFVVYTNTVSRDPLYAVTEVVELVDGANSTVSTVYTADRQFTIRDGKVESEKVNPLGAVPIIEYQANPERMGVFEAVLSLFDAINSVESNRVDGVEQFVQSLLVLENVDIDSDEFEELKRLGCIKVTSTDSMKANIQLLTAELNQDQTQTLVDALYKTALSICGMPFNTGGSASTSDTGAAVTMRDGWSNSESRCKETETFFKRSELRFLRIANYIMAQTYSDYSLKASDVEIKFTRRNYEAIQSKTQVLTTLLGCGKVHPRLAFEYSGMFPDPEAAYDQSSQYVEEQAKKQQEEFSQASKATPGDPVAGGDKGGANAAKNASGGVTAEGHGDATPVKKA